MAVQGDSFSVLANDLTSAEYLANELAFGTTYEFKVESRNSYGYSAFSNTVSLLCAYIPDPPLMITTANTNNLVTVSWDDPVDNGSVISAYKIYILEHDSVTYTEENSDCDGTGAEVVNSRACTIDLLTLTSAPYSLELEESVSVKIISVNTFGESAFSEAGNGAFVYDVPDAPVNLANDVMTTTDTVIKLSWENGSSDGGTSVVDYDVYYDDGQSNAVYTILAQAVTTKYYQTSVSLIAGETYSFKVTARNMVGNSPMSGIVSIIAAS